MEDKPDDSLLRRIVSGGQTGVDRAALDVAIESGMQHGGWCPRGRLAEDGAIPLRYRLTETGASDYWVRTEKNVVEGDATLILYRSTLSGGTELTRRFALKHLKPHRLVDLTEALDAGAVRDWLQQEEVAVLNVAGPRESSAPGIGREAAEFLRSVLSAR